MVGKNQNIPVSNAFELRKQIFYPKPLKSRVGSMTKKDILKSTFLLEHIKHIYRHPREIFPYVYDTNLTSSVDNFPKPAQSLRNKQPVAHYIALYRCIELFSSWL